MNTSRKTVLFVLVVVVISIGLVFGTLNLANGTASTDDGTPKHFITAKPLDSTPTSGDVLTMAALGLGQDSEIRRAIDDAVTNDTYVSTRVNGTEYDRIQSTLGSVPEYQHGGEGNGLLVEKNGTVVRVQYLTAIAA